ncbi:hypothetical protein VNI00_013018 [Paramarasmius palmivorus]|uniref:Uncharacterized protein n=1 Tax=Paramarasmius palmivorus TaxID=297713 RepID=A0AAW0C0A8_9AGAR
MGGTMLDAAARVYIDACSLWTSTGFVIRRRHSLSTIQTRPVLVRVVYAIQYVAIDFFLPERNEEALANEPRDSLDEELNKECRLRKAVRDASTSVDTASGSSNEATDLKEDFLAPIHRPHKRGRSSSIEGLGGPPKKRAVKVSEDEGVSEDGSESGSDLDESSDE